MRPSLTIGIDGTALYGPYGGVEYALWNLLLALNEADSPHRYIVYVPADGPDAAATAPFGANWRWHHLPFPGASKLRRILWQQLELPRQLRRDGCDLLHSPTYVCPLRAGRSVVLTVYDVIALLQPEFATRANRLHYGYMLPRSVRRATRIIVPAESVRTEIARLCPGAEGRATVIPLGVEELFFATPSRECLDAVRSRYDLPERFLLFAGNFEPKKNLGNLLAAVARHPDLPPLVIVGGVRAWRNNAVTGPQAVAMPGRRPIVLGYLPREVLPALFHLCEVFVFPSLAEGFGLPVLEALACGAPVVTSRAVRLPELGDYAALCDPHDPESIGEALLSRLREDGRPARREEAAAFARGFTWPRAAEATLRVYGEAVAAVG